MPADARLCAEAFRHCAHGIAMAAAGSSRIQICNPALARMHGRTADELAGTEILDLYPPEEHFRVLQAVDEADRTGEARFEAWKCRADGSRFPAETTLASVRDTHGSIQYRIASVQDITARKQAETALAAEVTRRRILTEGSRDGIVVLDTHGAVFEANHRFAEMLGYTPEEVRDLDVSAWDRDWPRERVIEAIRGMGPEGATFETRHWRKDGTVLHIELSNSVAQIDGQKLVFCICHDITQRKLAEAALRQSELRFRHLVETAFDWIWEVDPQGRYTYSSPRVLDLLGYTPEEILGRTPFELMPPAEAQRIRALFVEVSAKHAAVRHLENINLHKSGREVLIESSAVPILGDAGELLGYRGIDRDVTSRRQLESNLRQAQKLEAIGQLAGGVAHDFNNILGGILMQLGLLHLNGQLDPDTRLVVRELETEARRAADLTRQLLMFSRRSVLEVHSLDLDAVVTNLLKMLARLIGEQVQLRFERSPTPLPPVAADAGLLEQVLMNLVVNARDAMPRGGTVVIATSITQWTEGSSLRNPERRPGRFVGLSVSDTGTGIRRELLEHIFEPFFTTKEPGKGTGLGLATVHGIVAQHSGWVEVESQEGAGTTFRVFLPAAPQSPPPSADPAPTSRQPLPHGRETILLVEDSNTLRRAVARNLRALGYQVLEATNGRHALELWAQHPGAVDLLLTDMIMPEDMTGLELAQHLQTAQPHLKVILSSGYSTELVHAANSRTPAITHLPKPYEASVLAETIRTCLDGTEGRRAGPFGSHAAV